MYIYIVNSEGNIYIHSKFRGQYIYIHSKCRGQYIYIYIYKTEKMKKVLQQKL
jgi:hypothetical protein